MNAQERHATAEQLWSQLSDSKGFTVLPRESVVLNESIKQRGIVPVVNLLKPQNPDAIWRLWLDHAVLSAVIARGEVTNLWDATPEKGRGLVLSNVGPRLNQRQVVKSLASKQSLLDLADWLDSLTDRELQGLSPFQREPLAGCFYRVGLGQRYADFTNRSIASQRERIGSRVPPEVFARLKVANERTSLEIKRGEIDQVAARLRQSIHFPRGALNYVSLLVASELAESEWQSLQSKTSEQLAAEEKLLLVLLARSTGRTDKAIELAGSFELKYWPTLFAIENHQWDLASTGQVPPSSFQLSPIMLPRIELAELGRNRLTPSLMKSSAR